ncbi:MAG: hypothetical protein JWO53_747, partial [Chlamydiia bacterium]|nr:hypothetical protein [Chlamydiia bacterium]
MQRPKYIHEIELQFRVHTICALLGPMQLGKTTLSKMFLEQHPK